MLVGITHAATIESINLAHHAGEAGAQAVVYAGPSYFPVSQAELRTHIEHLVRELPLPVFLYNMPSHTKIAFDVETVHLAADFPQVVGAKDSSGSLDYFRSLCLALTDRPLFSLLIEREEILAEAIWAGGHGSVCGGANLYPRLFVALYNAVCAGESDMTAQLTEKIHELNRKIYRVGSCGSSYLRGLKCALSVLGICSDFLAKPFECFAVEERDAIRRGLIDLQLL